MRWPWALAALALAACPAPPLPPCEGGGCAARGPCDAGAFVDGAGVCQQPGWTACGPGFTADSSGWGCDAVAGEACAAGTMAPPGEACAAVGWAQCPPGFTRAAGGWSCEPTLPATPCTGATRAALGSPTCQPVGDCAAPFPPAAATLFVDASLDAGQLDATHFARISDALAAAAPGATIAVAPGAYAESLVPARPVTLVGRCAGLVQLTGGAPALAVNAVQGVVVEGLTVRDSTLAARVERGGRLTLRHAVLEANLRSAVQAVDADSLVTLEDVVIRGTLADPATQTFGQGIAASFAAQLTLSDVEITRSHEAGLFLDRAGTHASLTRTVISGTLPRASTGKLGWGGAVQGGASLDGQRLVLQDNRVTGLLVAQSPSSATLVDTVVRRTALGLDNGGSAAGMGVTVLLGGALSWTGGAVEDAPQGLVYVSGAGSAATLRSVTAQRGGAPPSTAAFGLSAQGSAQLGLDHVALLGAGGSGVLALGLSQVSLDHVAILDTGGVGLRAQDGAQVTGAAVEVRRHAAAAVQASHQGALTLSGCVLAEASTAPWPDGGVTGFGAVASEAGALTLSRCLVDRNAGAGVYASRPGASATLSSTVVRETALDAHGEYGQGVVAEGGGRVDLEDVAVTRNHTAGLQVADAASVIAARRVTVRATQPNALGARGRGANASFGGTLRALSSAFVDNQQVGLFAFQSAVECVDTVVLGTRADPDGTYGNGLEALTDGTISFTRGALADNAGIAAVFAEGAGLLDGVWVSRNPVGLHAQDGSTVEELAATPPTLGPRQVVVTAATAFEGNRAKLGEGTVPVPAP